MNIFFLTGRSSDRSPLHKNRGANQIRKLENEFDKQTERLLNKFPDFCSFGRD